MITLSHQKPFAKGSRRQCYVYQEDTTKCIKVILPERPPELIRSKSKLYKKVMSPKHFDENLNEVKGHKLLFWYEHFPVCFDTVDTDLGTGLVVELIRNDDGEISPTVADVLKQRDLNAAESNALTEFFDYLLKHAIIVRDLTARNVVLQRQAGRIKAYMVDGFGNSDFLPFVKFSTRLARAKLLRKIGRSFKFMDYHWQPDVQLESQHS
jgi:hypothetical protein